MDRVGYNSGSNRAINLKIWFEIMRVIIDYSLNCTTQSPITNIINGNHNKIQEEFDSGINYLTGWYIQLLLKQDAEREPIQVQLAQALWCILFNYSGMVCATVQLRLKSGLVMINWSWEFWCIYDYYNNYYYYLINRLLLSIQTIVRELWIMF